MKDNDIIKARCLLMAKAKEKDNYPKVQGGQKTWFFCRQLHFVGVGEVLHVYPTDIGHGPETPLCKVKGQIMGVEGHYEDFEGAIHQDDVCHSKKEAIRGLMLRLSKKADKRRGEMIDAIHLQGRWGMYL